MSENKHVPQAANLESISTRSFAGRLSGYARMTGPGWLQAAVTLGGVLAGALYLGVIVGYSLLWLHPLAMLCGVAMLMTLAHITLDKGEYPFNTDRRSISPLLAWGWLAATIVTDIVFCTTQSSLGVATLQQNLGLGATNPYVITVPLSVVAFVSATLYALGSGAMRKFELLLKILVGIVVLSFISATLFLLISGKVDIVALFAGLVPDPRALFNPTASLDPLISATESSAQFWNDFIAESQRSRIIAAFGSAACRSGTGLPLNCGIQPVLAKAATGRMAGIRIGNFIGWNLDPVASGFHKQSKSLQIPLSRQVDVTVV